MMKRVADPDWFAYVRAGDVLQRGQRGSYRVVREVSRWECHRRGVTVRDVGPLRCITFAIRRRSWTNRCYTVYTAADLRTMGFRYVGARVRLESEMDALIEAAIQQPNSHPKILTADDVRGVA